MGIGTVPSPTAGLPGKPTDASSTQQARLNARCGLVVPPTSPPILHSGQSYGSATGFPASHRGRTALQTLPPESDGGRTARLPGSRSDRCRWFDCAVVAQNNFPSERASIQTFLELILRRSLIKQP